MGTTGLRKYSKQIILASHIPMQKSKMEEKPKKKPRKVTAGPIREKARTMEKLIAAVGKVIKKHGYPGLTVANIASESGLDRKLVYTYFGSLDNLIELYITRQDYWKSKANKQIETLLQAENLSKLAMVNLLQGQFEQVLNDKILQRIIHWELGVKSKPLRKLADSREEVGELLLNKFEESYPNKDIDLRALLAIQTAGLYYLALHASSNGSTFCGIDINTPEGKERINRTIENTLDLLISTSGKPKED